MKPTDLTAGQLAEVNIRLGVLQPPRDNPDGPRWASEGMPRLPDGRPDYRNLETVRRPTP